MIGISVETLEKISKIAPYAFIILGFLVTLLGQFVLARLEKRIKHLEDEAELSRKHRHAKIAPYVFIILGVLVALAGQFVAAKSDQRIKYLKDEAELSRKRTPPKLDAQLAISDKGNLFVVVDSQNEIPFMASWLLTTEQNKVVSGLMLGQIEFYPTKETQKWQYKQDIQLDGVINNYVELSFDYMSVYSAELNHPADLSGNITHKYRLINGAPYPID
ncbi:MAG TPA: hypothetical protein VNI02_01560 [Blastocatellia bacterium]|jgi:hypothetical protein|nr:hypothetical protein [Blastocatellia bacterium]